MQYRSNPMPRHSLKQALMERAIQRIRSDRLEQWGSLATAAETAVKAMRRGNHSLAIELPDGTRTNAVTLCDDLDLWEFVDDTEQYREDNFPQSVGILMFCKQALIFVWLGSALWVTTQVLPDLVVANRTTGAIALAAIYAVTSLYSLAHLQLVPQIFKFVLKGSLREVERRSQILLAIKLGLEVLLIAATLFVLTQTLPGVGVGQFPTFFWAGLAMGLFVPALGHRFDTPLKTLFAYPLWQTPLYFLLNLGLWLLVPGVLLLASGGFPGWIQVRSPAVALTAAIVMETGSYLYDKIGESVSKLEDFDRFNRYLKERSSLFLAVAILWTSGTLLGIVPAIVWVAHLLVDGFTLPHYFAYLLAALLFNVARWPSKWLLKKCDRDLDSYFGVES